MDTIEPMTLVLVLWDDSMQPTTGWCWLKDVPQRAAASIQTVGWVLRSNPNHIALTASLSLPDEDGEQQVCGVIIIPTCSILKTTVLGRAEAAA